MASVIAATLAGGGVCMIDGLSIIDSLGNIKGLSVKVRDGTASTGDSVVLTDNRTGNRIFAGYVKEVTKVFIKPTTAIEELLVQDFTRRIDDVEYGVTGIYTPQNEKTILTDIFTKFCNYINVGTYVVSSQLSATATANFQDLGMRQAVDDLASGTSGTVGTPRTWYVDYAAELHYFTAGGEAAPFELSDTPNNTTTFPYDYKRFRYTLDAVDSKKRGTVVCWKEGLYAGMTLKLTNSVMGWNSQPFTIYEVKTKVLNVDSSNPLLEYTVSFGSETPARITKRIKEIEQSVEKIANINKTIVFAVAGTLATGANVSFEIPAPMALRIANVYANVRTAPGNASVILDVNKNGVTIFSTQSLRPMIAPGSTTGISGIPNITTVAINDILSLDNDQVDGTAADLVAQIRCSVEIG